jgi:hypothetical protein
MRVKILFEFIHRDKLWDSSKLIHSSQTQKLYFNKFARTCAVGTYIKYTYSVFWMALIRFGSYSFRLIKFAQLLIISYN